MTDALVFRACHNCHLGRALCPQCAYNAHAIEVLKAAIIAFVRSSSFQGHFASQRTLAELVGIDVLLLTRSEPAAGEAFQASGRRRFDAQNLLGCLNLPSLNDLYPNAFWSGWATPQAKAGMVYSEFEPMTKAFKRWWSQRPDMPNTISGNTQLFEAFKRGWMEEKDRWETIIIKSPSGDVGDYNAWRPIYLVRTQVQSFAANNSLDGMALTDIFMVGGKVFTSIEPVEEFRRRFKRESQ